MTRKIPKFPDSYIGESAEEYNSHKWMERNQKNTTLRCIEFLYDKNLGENDIDLDAPYLILDLGCGTGYSSEVLIQHGFRVIGIDILPDMLEKANHNKNTKSNKGLELVLADINYLPFKKDSIDHLISISAYNFITHGKNSIREERKIVNNTAKYLKEILKKNGRFILEFYPQDDRKFDLFVSSFKNNGFEGFSVKDNPKQKGGQTFLLLKKEG